MLMTGILLFGKIAAGAVTLLGIYLIVMGK